MKSKIFIYFLVSIVLLISIKVSAQQAPDLPMAPPMAPPETHRSDNTELFQLLRAQTEAIKSLSNKIDTLEERIDKLERGER